jgi:hypothetical protein
MSLAQQSRGHGPRKSGKGQGPGGSQQPLTASPEFANSFIAEALINEAARQGGVCEADLELFGRAAAEDPESWEFAEDDERKQQKDSLPALRPKHDGKEYEDFETGRAFIKGDGDHHAVDPHDVKQGALGDCYLIAGMAAVARADPQAIQDCIKDKGDGTFDVTLHLRRSRHAPPVPVTRTVDARLAVKASGKPLYAGTGDKEDGGVELWAALIEKTVAQHKESYDLISGSKINGEGFVYAGASELLAGKGESYLRTDSMDEDDCLLHIAMALEGKQSIVASSRNLKDDEELTREANKLNVYWNHAYAPESVDLDARTVTLQNPWGSHHVTDLPVDLFMKFYKALRVGASSPGISV